MTLPPPTWAVLQARLGQQARVKHLQVMVQVADLGSLQKAAERLGLSQPAATQVLASLEQLLGLRLFERHARGMRLSPAGQALLPGARRALEAMQALAGTTAAWHDGAAGVVRVAALSSAISGVLAHHLGAFNRRHPEIQIELVEMGLEQLATTLARQGADLFLCRDTQPLPDGYHCTVLEEDQCLVVAEPDHPLATRAQLGWADCADQTWLVPPPGVPARRHFDAVCAREGLVPRLCRVHTLSAFAAWGLMQGSGMLGVVPRHFIRQSLRSGALVSLPLQVPGAMPAMALVTPIELGTAAALLATHLRRSHGLAP